MTIAETSRMSPRPAITDQTGFVLKTSSGAPTVRAAFPSFSFATDRRIAPTDPTKTRRTATRSKMAITWCQSYKTFFSMIYGFSK